MGDIQLKLGVNESPLARKLEAFTVLPDEDRLMLDRIHRSRKCFVAGRDIVHQGEREQAAYIVAAGWVSSYKIQPDGSRQIIDFQIPGDFLGLRSVLLRVSDHSFEPIGNIQATEVRLGDLMDILSGSPRLATAILWAASRDEAMVVEHLINVGKRSAVERMAHFLLELAARLSLVGMGSKDGYDCPLTQYHLADALGMSSIHVNRVLRTLREDGLVTFQNGHVSFHDIDRLIDFSGFDPSYLDQKDPIWR